MDNKINEKFKSEPAVSLDGEGIRVQRVFCTTSIFVLRAFLESIRSNVCDLFDYEEFTRGFKILNDFLISYECSLMREREFHDMYGVFELK